MGLKMSSNSWCHWTFILTEFSDLDEADEAKLVSESEKKVLLDEAAEFGGDQSS